MKIKVLDFFHAFFLQIFRMFEIPKLKKNWQLYFLLQKMMQSTRGDHKFQTCELRMTLEIVRYRPQ